MQTRKAPPRAGSLAEATAAGAQGQGRGKPAQGAAPPSVFQGGLWARWLTWARHGASVRWVLLCQLWATIYLRVPDCPRPRLKLKHQGQPDAFGDVKCAFADMDVNLPWQLGKRSFYGGNRGCLGQSMSGPLPVVRRKVQRSLQGPSWILKVPVN